MVFQNPEIAAGPHYDIDIHVCVFCKMLAHRMFRGSNSFPADSTVVLIVCVFTVLRVILGTQRFGLGVLTWETSWLKKMNQLDENAEMTERGVRSLKGRGLWLGGRAIIESTKLPTNLSCNQSIN